MISLSSRNIDFLLGVLELPRNLLVTLERARRGDGQIADEVADTLRDLCCARYVTHGVGADYESTEEGELLDEMIDRLFTG